MDIQNLTSVPVVVINSLLTLLKANHIDINSVVMQLSNDKDEDINLGELTQQTLNELQKAKAQKVAVPEGFVLVQKELPESIAEELALKRVSKPFGETDPVWVEITEKVYKEHLLSKKWELCRDYKTMIEAQEQVG